jgi:hypothetical protein
MLRPGRNQAMFKVTRQATRAGIPVDRAIPATVSTSGTAHADEAKAFAEKAVG